MLTLHILSEYMKCDLFTMNDPDNLSILLMHVTHKPYKIKKKSRDRLTK